MLLGDGFLMDHRKNPKLEVEMTNKTFIEWLKEELGYICTGTVSVNDSEGTGVCEGFNVKKSYTIWTHSLESLRKYRNWLDDIWTEGGESLETTPLKLKLWYVSNGNINRGGRGGCHAQINTGRVKSDNQLENVFDSIGMEFTRAKWGNRLNFTVSESQKLWDYMGDPLPGFEYKWPDGPEYSEVIDEHTEEI